MTKKTTIDDHDAEAIKVLLNATANIPFLATMIFETIHKAGLKLVKK